MELFIELIKLVAFVLAASVGCLGFTAAVIFGLINPMLSPEQRYGIDEHGNALTPEYVKETNIRYEWWKVASASDSND